VQYQATRPNKEGVWRVLRISASNPKEFQVANIKNNPGKTIDYVIDNYLTLSYNYVNDLE
jgi:hypothetical protein